MKINFAFFLILWVLARGNKETDVCAISLDSNSLVTDEWNLRCTFSENVNQTGKDFVAYFYPDHGKEERLIDCGWIRKKLECVTQEGVECKQPVSDTAVIRVPGRFTKKAGSYKCVIAGHKPDTVEGCHFKKSQSENKDEENFTTCETTSDGNQMTLKCNFPFHCEGFSIHQNETVLSSFKKSECQSSGLCMYTLVDNKSIFTVKLDVSKHHSDDEYSCHPDNSSRHFKVQGCTTTHSNHTEGSSSPVLAIVLPVTLVLFLVLLAKVLLVSVLRRKVLDRRAPSEAERTENEEMNFIECKARDGTKAA